MFRLNVDDIWPEGGSLKWKLRYPSAFDRNTLVSFCERLVIELECPQITLDLTAPGPLQILLQELLSNRIGVGRFPNRELNLADSAIKLTYRANLARARQETITPPQVLRDLGVRTDFGRVAQKFPVIQNQFVSRRQAIDVLLALIHTKKLVGLIGAPGSGKSWILTQFAEYGVKANFIVTRHFCYLEPGDEVRDKRITSDVFFGNVIADLYDSLPSLECADAPKYSAGPEELVKLLAAARRSNPQRQIILIVDGLDHIERVLAEAPTVPRSETRIIDELANLDLPDGVSIVIGSQPGDHLVPLRTNDNFVELSSWTEEEIKELATKLGTIRKVSEFFGKDAINEFVSELHARSEGNPLYATYLCREMEVSISTGRSGSLVELVRHAPQYNGELNNYYRYLVGPDIPDPVACILAYIDFAITRIELAEIAPFIQPQLATLLVKLRPVLTEVTGQGGLRIYHESFRRFIVGLLSQHETHRNEVLQKISNWLEKRGFPRDSRSYRYLLSYLFKQANCEQILKYVGNDFVTLSVQNGYPAEAVLDNLGIAADAAKVANDWPGLCRVAELRKSVYTCFEEKMEFAAYIRANLAVNGANRVAEQLLFDGKPTRSRDEGLIACSICDDAGVTPPWREYLRLSGDQGIRDREVAALAEFHGWARIASGPRFCVSIARWLRWSAEPPELYVRGVLSRLANIFGVQTLERLISVRNIAPRALYHLHIAIASLSQQAGDKLTHTTIATSLAQNVRDACECLSLGANPSTVDRYCPNVEELTSELLHNGHIPDEDKTKDWIAAVSVLAFLDTSRLRSIWETITIDGWYTAWMRSVIQVAVASTEVSHNALNAENTVIHALRELANERSPFRGEPRACDLYSIRDTIHAFWRRALALIRSPEGMYEALNLLSQISDSTTTYLQGSPNGPLTMEALAEIAEALLSRSEVRSFAVNVIESLAQVTETGLYEIQATLELKLASAYAADADSRAEARWQRGCQCLTAYGFRRDTTVFELIHSISCLLTLDRAQSTECLKDLQPLVTSLDYRTDGKDTRGGPIHWYEALFATTPIQAIVLLARSLMEGGGMISWRLETCLENVLQERMEGQPGLLFALFFTVPPSDERISINCQTMCIEWIERILLIDNERGRLAYQRLLVRLGAMPKRVNPTVFDLLSSFVARHDLPALPTTLKASTTDAEHDHFSHFSDPPESGRISPSSPLFPEDASSLLVMRILRRRGYTNYTTEEIAAALGEKLLQIVRAARGDEAAWLISTFAREVYFDTKTDILARVGEYLNQHGEVILAAISYALAGWYFRHDTSWFTGFDEQHIAYLQVGRQLDAKTFDRTIAEQVVASIKNSEGYTVGNSCRLVHIASHRVSSELAFGCWRAAYEVIRHRMPEWQHVSFAMSPFEPSYDSDWSLDEALCFLLLSRISHPDLERKQVALTGFADILSRCPEIAGKAVAAVLDRDTTLTSVLLILSTLWVAEASPFPCTQIIAESLRPLLDSDLFALRMVSKRLLARIRPVDINRGE